MRKKLAILVVISSILVVISSILAVIRGSWLLCLIGKAWFIAVFFGRGGFSRRRRRSRVGLGSWGFFGGLREKNWPFWWLFRRIWLSFGCHFVDFDGV
jgi:hypothetical protein